MDNLMCQIQTAYASLTPEVALELNELEFRLGFNDGHAFQPNIGVIDFDLLLKNYTAVYGAPTKMIMLTMVEQGGAFGLESSQIRLLTLDSIKAFCITGIPGPEALYYTKKKQSFALADQPLRVSFGKEMPFPATPTVWSKMHFRYAQRFSFIHPDGKSRADFTVIHAGDGANIHASGVLDPKCPEKYEVEIEFDHYDPARMKTALTFLLRQYHGGITMAPLSVLTGALNQYLAVCNRFLRTEPSPIKEVSTCIPMAYHGDANTLVKHFCLDLMPDISEILTDTAVLQSHDYVVTDKADGRRAFLFTTCEGVPYLLYKKTLKKGLQSQGALIIIPTGLRQSPFSANSVYDGEFIFIDGNPFFLCFDVLYTQNLVGSQVPFAQRLAHMQAVLSQPYTAEAEAEAEAEARLTICRKIFVPLTQLASLRLNETPEGLQRVLDNPKITYPLDGLIFQRLSVAYPTTGQKWEGTIKWKSPEETSMDFKIAPCKHRLIVAGPEIGEPAGSKFWQVGLIYGFHQRCRYFGYIPLEDHIARIKDRAAVDVGDIIECKLEQKPGGMAPYWTGYRLRRDKRFPNNETTYNGNMAAIASNICLSTLKKLKPAAPPALPAVNPMNTVNKFNRRISNQHIYNYASEISGGKIFEFAVGSAQSASAWKFAHVTEVVGIDILSDLRKNVEPSDGFFKKDNPDRVKTAYYVADMCTDLTKHDELCTVTVKCDLAVCNFAIHYAFRSKTSLVTFLKNIAVYLKPGGYFIGTYMASHCIAQLPTEASAIPGFTYYSGTIAPGRLKIAVAQTGGHNNENNVWSIEGACETRKSIYGNAITVDIVERPLSQEFAINLENPAIHAVFAQHGFTYVPETAFIRKAVLFQFKTTSANFKLNAYEQRWADIHRQFVFQYTGITGITGILPAPTLFKKLTLKRKAEKEIKN